MAQRFSNKVIVITGAGGGLGQTTAVKFAAEGATLVLLDINEAGLQETKTQVERAGGAATYHVFDMGDEAAIKHHGAEICANHPEVHVLYNNAGIAYGEVNKMINEMSMERWLYFLSINSVAPVLMAEALRPSLARAKGLILNQSSMASFQPANVYGTTKAMLNSLTFGMANIYGPEGIRCNAIAPGLMETPASKGNLPAETQQRIQGMQMVDMHGTAEDIANLALFLSSDEGRFINCEIISCDAGNRLRGWRG